MGKPSTIDDIDRRLLELVRRDNQTPARILAEQLGLSISAVLRRLRRLREDKIIVADIAVLDPALTGTTLTIFVLVRLNRSSRQDKAEVSRRIALRTEVTGAWELVGEDQFMLKVQVDTMEEYDDLVRQALTEEAGVDTLKPLITVREVVTDYLSVRPLRGSNEGMN